MTATYGYGGLFQAAGQKYPDTNFYTIIPSNYAGNVRTYFVRIYQLRYLQGILAGLKTQTGYIGFISYDRTPDNVQELDAFALGVRHVNPTAHVLAAFQPLLGGTDEDARRLAGRMIRDAHVDVLASHRVNDAVAAYAVTMRFAPLACSRSMASMPVGLSGTSCSMRYSAPMAFAASVSPWHAMRYQGSDAC